MLKGQGMDELTHHQDLSVPTSEPIPVVALGMARVLVVEDDRTTRLILVSALRSAGYRVREAGRLDEARRLLAEETPDLLVVDGLLPDGTGMDLIAECRARYLKMEFIFLSAFFRDFRSFQSLRGNLAVQEVLHKPVTPQKLVGTVAKLLLSSDRARDG